MRVRGSSEDDRDATDTTGSDPGAGSARGRGHRAGGLRPRRPGIGLRLHPAHLGAVRVLGAGQGGQGCTEGVPGEDDGAVSRAAHPLDGTAPLNGAHPRPSRRWAVASLRAPLHRGGRALARRGGRGAGAAMRPGHSRSSRSSAMDASSVWRDCRTDTCTTCANRAGASVPCSPRPDPDPWPSHSAASPAPIRARGHRPPRRLDGAKGVYHINTVDEITQYEHIGTVQAISERCSGARSPHRRLSV